MHLASPLTFDARGRTGAVDDDRHIRDLIEAVLLTAPGERVNRPDFGSGLLHLVFSPAGDEIASAVQALAQASLQRWLGDLIEVESVVATMGESDDSTLRVTVRYLVRRTGERSVATFARAVGAGAGAGP